jgi:protein-S-isoprenylcysteine O-methyltransferase Ste14
MSNQEFFLWSSAALFVIGTPLCLWFLRREYRLRGKLSWFGTILHFVLYGLHGMFSGLLAWGPAEIPPMSAFAWLGIPLMVFGFGVVLYAMDFFKTFSRWLGSNLPGLSTGKLYRYSRNPQFIGYGLFILGFFIAWWNPLAWLGLFGYLGLVYAVTLVEEEHLTRVYGDAYRQYCQQTPRYFGIRKSQ